MTHQDHASRPSARDPLASHVRPVARAEAVPHPQTARMGAFEVVLALTWIFITVVAVAWLVHR